MSQEVIDKATLTQISNIEKNTGKKLNEWITMIRQSGLEKHGALVSYLKVNHGFTHGNANLVVHYAMQSHAGAAENSDDLISAQYLGKENLLPLFEEIVSAVRQFGDGLEMAPKKAYVSLRRRKQFALIQPSTKERLDIGLSIKGEAADKYAQAAGSWNGMCTHRIKLESGQIITPELIGWLRKAWVLAE